MNHLFPATRSLRNDSDLASLRGRFWRGAAELTLADVATRLGTTPEALRFRIYRGTCPVPFSRASVEYRFRAEDVDAYLESEAAA